MRAPPLSLRPMTGAPTFSAMSITLQIFSAWRLLSEPPKTVKSWLNTKTRRPLMVPEPVTTPSPGTFCSSIPKSMQSCSTYVSSSSKLSSSSSTSSRSRAVSLPLACCASMRFCPPPSFAAARRRSSSAILADMCSPFDARRLGRGKAQRQAWPVQPCVPLERACEARRSHDGEIFEPAFNQDRALQFAHLIGEVAVLPDPRGDRADARVRGGEALARREGNVEVDPLRGGDQLYCYHACGVADDRSGLARRDGGHRDVVLLPG